MPEKFREEIDKIDAALAGLLERRLDAAREIGGWKREHGLPATDAERGEDVLERAVSYIENSENKPLITGIWRQIMAASREIQLSGGSERNNAGLAYVHELINMARAPVANPGVVFQGIEGSNSHEAAAAYFGGGVRASGVSSFERVCRAVKTGEADYGILPLENNTTGPVALVRGLIDRYGLYITGEQNLRIEHCLLAPRGAKLGDIKEVISHEQALLQCSGFLESLGNIRATAGPNTAICARDTALEGNARKAAIASPFAAELYGLDILRDAISDNPGNCTRFAVVSGLPELPAGRDKVSVLFAVRHRAGELYRVLGIFAGHDLNLSKLESMPLGGVDFEYLFLADFTGDITRENTQKAISAIHDECTRVRVLGNYKSKRRNIVLTGMPGCGKNSIGKELAARLGMDYADTDEIVERAAGCSISEIFAKKGEPAFRDMESEAVTLAAARGGQVISTGGGTMTRPENVRALRGTGLVFFINRPVGDILAGVDLSDRPLLAAEPQKIHALYEERLPVYRAAADHEIENGGELSHTVEALDRLIGYLRSGAV